MNSDGRSTSQQLYIPILLVVGGCPTLVGRCTTAADSAGLGVKTCSLAEAPEAIPLRHPLAIVVPNRAFDSASDELLALARDVRSVLFPVDAEVTVRELEAMFAAAIAACSSQRDRRNGAGRYSLTEGFAEEAPFSRRGESRTSWNPSPPSARGARPSFPPSVRSARPPAPRDSMPPSSRAALSTRQILPRVTPAGRDPAPGLATTRPLAAAPKAGFITADDLPTYRPPPMPDEDPHEAPETLRPGPGLHKSEPPPLAPPPLPRDVSPSIAPRMTEPPCSRTQPVERPSYAALRAVFSSR